MPPELYKQLIRGICESKYHDYMLAGDVLMDMVLLQTIVCACPLFLNPC